MGACEHCGARDTWEQRLVTCQADVVVAKRLELGLEKFSRELRGRCETPLVKMGGLDATRIPRPSAETLTRLYLPEGAEEPAETRLEGLVFTDGSRYPRSAKVGRRAGWGIAQWSADPSKRWGFYGNLWAPVQQTSAAGEWLGWAVGQQSKIPGLLENFWWITWGCFGLRSFRP